MPYEIKIETFEGPFDLLLYLVKKNDLDIYNIPISQITEEYLKYVDMMKDVDLGFAGEFLVMAATLMKIKSKSLLPHDQADEDEIEELKKDLTDKLLEYKKYKEMSLFFQQKEIEQKETFERVEPGFKKEELEIDASIFDLLDAFKKVLEESKKEIKEILPEEIAIEERMRKILLELENKKYVTFSMLFSKDDIRQLLIVTFLALLELIKGKQIYARQSKLFGEIRIYKKILLEEILKV